VKTEVRDGEGRGGERGKGGIEEEALIRKPVLELNTTTQEDRERYSKRKAKIKLLLERRKRSTKKRKTAGHTTHEGNRESRNGCGKDGKAKFLRVAVTTENDRMDRKPFRTPKRSGEGLERLRNPPAKIKAFRNDFSTLRHPKARIRDVLTDLSRHGTHEDPKKGGAVLRKKWVALKNKAKPEGK